MMSNRNQLDNILTRIWYRNSANNSLSSPVVDIGSGHNLVIMTVDDIGLKKIKLGSKKRKFKLQKLKENPDPFKYNFETKLESMKTQQTGIKSSNERLKELIDILFKGAVQSHNRIKKIWINIRWSLWKLMERRMCKFEITREARKNIFTICQDKKDNRRKARNI